MPEPVMLLTLFCIRVYKSRAFGYRGNFRLPNRAELNLAAADLLFGACISVDTMQGFEYWWRGDFYRQAGSLSNSCGSKTFGASIQGSETHICLQPVELAGGRPGSHGGDPNSGQGGGTLLWQTNAKQYSTGKAGGCSF